jgi:hypothetical protein
MSRPLAALALALVGFATWLALKAQVAPVADLGEPPRAARPAAPTAAPAPSRLLRDPFRYADEPVARAQPPVPVAEPPVEPPPPAATPEPIRLSGFVRRGKELKAVLWISGTTVVVAAGETAEGYRVLTVDEDSGVRVRDGSGGELLLRPAPPR